MDTPTKRFFLDLPGEVVVLEVPSLALGPKIVFTYDSGERSYESAMGGAPFQCDCMGQITNMIYDDGTHGVLGWEEKG